MARIAATQTARIRVRVSGSAAWQVLLFLINGGVFILIALFAILRAVTGASSRRPWSPADDRAGLLFTIVVDVQLLLGLLPRRWAAAIASVRSFTDVASYPCFQKTCMARSSALSRSKERGRPRGGVDQGGLGGADRVRGAEDEHSHQQQPYREAGDMPLVQDEAPSCEGEAKDQSQRTYQRR